MSSTYTLKPFLALAESLGADTSRFSTSPLGFYQDSKLVCHRRDDCSYAPPRGWLRRKSSMKAIRIGDLSTMLLCDGCAPASQLWLADTARTHSDLKELGERLKLWEAARSDLSDPVAALGELQFLEKELTLPGSWQRRPELVDVGARLRAQMARRISELESFLSSNACRDLLVSVCASGAAPLPGNALLAVPALKPEKDEGPNKPPTPDLLQVALTTWPSTLRSGVHSLELPKDVALVAYHAARAYAQDNRLAGKHLGIADLVPSDDEAIIETAVSLWAPADPGPLQTLEGALSAARGVV